MEGCIIAVKQIKSIIIIVSLLVYLNVPVRELHLQQAVSPESHSELSDEYYRTHH